MQTIIQRGRSEYANSFAYLFACSKGVSIEPSDCFSGFVRSRPRLDVNVSDRSHLAPLMSAPPKVAEKLIGAGADVNARDDYNKTPLMYACDYGMRAKAWKDEDDDDDYERGDDCEYKKDSEDAVRILIDAGADVNARDMDDMTALMYACKQKRVSPAVVEALVKAGADVNAGDWNGKTPLMYVSESANVEAAIVLITNGADINAREKDGWSALMYAYKGDSWPHRKMADALRCRGADLNARDGDGKTLLMLACETGDLDLARALADAGAEVSAKDSRGETVIDKTQQKEMRLFLKQALKREKIRRAERACWEEYKRHQEVLALSRSIVREIVRICTAGRSGKFTRKQLMARLNWSGIQQAAQLKHRTGVLSKALQVLRDEGELEFVNIRGPYRWLHYRWNIPEEV